MIQDHFNFAIKSLRKRKTRAGLTILGIVIAVATIFILLSLSLGLREAINEQFRTIGTDKFIIQPKGQIGGPGAGGAVQLTLDDVDAVKKVSGIQGVTYMTMGSAQIEFNNKIRYYIVAGLPLDDEKALKALTEAAGWKIDDGDFLKKGDKNEVMIGSRYKTGNLFGKPAAVGNKITINGKDFRVKGILASVGNPSDDQNIFMNYNDFKILFNSSNRVDVIYVQILPGEDLSEIANKTEKALIKERKITEKTKDFSIVLPEELLATFGNILNILTAFLGGIAAISLIVGGIGIANTMYTSVLERTKEIGTMKAIGARNSDILYIFLIESGLLGLVGGVLGVILGVIVSKIIEYIIQVSLATTLLRVSFNIWLFIGCLSFAFLIGMFSGFLPSYQASKLNPVDALRYE